MKAYLPLVPLYLMLVAPAYAADLQCGGVNPPCLSQSVTVLKNVISLLAPLAGIALLIMLIIGGYQFITSGGDPKAVGGAKNTLTYALIGIFLVVVAWLIIVLVQAITGIEIITVEFPIT